MEKVSLLLVDFDRTITDEALRVDEDCLSQIRDLKGAGVHTTLVTGRKSSFVESFLRSHPATFESAVCENGCIAFFKSSRVVLSSFTARDVIIDRFRESRIPFDCGDCIISTESLSKEQVDSLLKGIAGWNAVVNVDSVMILPPGIDKGTGIRWVQSRIDIPRNETAGIGDGENDMVMRENCGILGAPASAVNPLKAAADFVSDHSYSRGTIDFIAYLKGNLSLPRPMRK